MHTGDINAMTKDVDRVINKTAKRRGRGHEGDG